MRHLLSVLTLALLGAGVLLTLNPSSAEAHDRHWRNQHRHGRRVAVIHHAPARYFAPVRHVNYSRSHWRGPDRRWQRAYYGDRDFYGRGCR